MSTLTAPIGQTAPVRHELCSHPLDELDALNHFCFGGARDLTRQFRVLTINVHSRGDETLFLAAQLAATDALIIHYDPSPADKDYVQCRAEHLRLGGRIRFLSGSLHDLLASLLSTANVPGVCGETAPSFGPFDYVRCCGALDHSDRPYDLFELATRFLKEDGVLGISCLAHYGREPYRQMQSLARLLGTGRSGSAGDAETVAELCAFLECAPRTNRAVREFVSVVPELRDTAPGPFAEAFLGEDLFAPTLPRLYEMLDQFGFELIQFSRDVRPLYEPWFASKNPALAARLAELPARTVQAIAEVAWSASERHHFWAMRRPASPADPFEPDHIPFFNYFADTKHAWKKHLRSLTPGEEFRLNIVLSEEERYAILVPWNRVLRRFIELLDGYKTLGEIALIIREESCGEMGIDDISRTLAHFIRSVQPEDMILLRHKSIPILPFTMSRLRS